LNNKTSGILPTAIIPGDRIVVELQVPVGIDYGHLKIASLSHAFIDIFGLHDSETTGIGASGSCNKDVIANMVPTGKLLKELYAECKLPLPGSFCSGTLLNNSAIDGKLFFLQQITVLTEIPKLKVQYSILILKPIFVVIPLQ
jgi:hypothetical protein